MAENESGSVSTEVTEDALSSEVVEEVEQQHTERAEIPPEVKRALSKANKEAETLRLRLKEIEDRDKTDAQKLQEERDALRAERDALALQSLRREVADEKGLTPAQARRLIGTTREEMEADADDLIAAFPKPKPAFGSVGQGARTDAAARVYKQAELNDHAFFLAHKDDILAAYREGRITTD